jgi:hypothetical protein
MHYEIHQQLAQAHQADLLREAEKHRLALVARGSGSVKRRGRVASFLAQIRRQRPQQRPAPAV